jgi:hypothetical protein
MLFYELDFHYMGVIPKRFKTFRFTT